MGTWQEGWAERIWEVHKALPENATLEERKKALREIGPHKSSASWAKKSWQKARKAYLSKFGYVSPNVKKVPESPLERMMRREGEA